MELVLGDEMKVTETRKLSPGKALEPVTWLP